MKKIVNLLHKNLSYKLQGIAFDIRKNFGLGHKEQIYQKAFEEELKRINIPYEKEKAIKIYSPKDGKFIGLYRPDFVVSEIEFNSRYNHIVHERPSTFRKCWGASAYVLIDKKIVVELKTFKFVPKEEMRKVYDYLRNSEYELGYLINFASPELYVKRIIFTNDKKDWFKKLLVSVSLWLVLFSGLPSIVDAAVLYLEPSQGDYYQGDTFIVEARIDTEGECINAIEANLSFSPDVLEAVDFSSGDSILTLWVKLPTIDQNSGLISFIGGTPGGYCGILPGDSGKSNLLGKIIFRVVPRDVSRNLAQIIFKDDSQVLLNDGKGTKTELTTKGAVFNILQDKPEIPKNEWQEELKKDTIPPEPFKIEIAKDPSIFDGKYFIAFFTTDKQTGIDYYEVKEGKGDWKRTTSPYLLEDQSLKSIIKVKAVDKAGNERIAEYSPPRITKKITKETLKIIFFIIIGLIIIGCIVKKYLLKRYQ